MINLVKPNKFLLILFFFTTSAFCAASENADQVISNLIQSTQNLPLQQRIIQISHVFLNKPYELEPLGEGGVDEFNHKPLYRLDVFDCETFVDTVMALALANNLQQFQGVINKIRYHNDEVSFATRNHFTSADWIPNAQKMEIIKDLTKVIGGESVKTSHVFINRKSWYQHLLVTRINRPDLDDAKIRGELQKLQSFKNTVSNSTASVDYIPAATLLADLKIVNKIPDGAIIFLVLENPEDKKIIGTQNNISHMGFAIWKNKILYLRAASTLRNNVADLSLLQYLSRYSPATGLRGISVWQTTLPPPSYFQGESIL